MKRSDAGTSVNRNSSSKDESRVYTPTLDLKRRLIRGKKDSWERIISWAFYPVRLRRRMSTASEHNNAPGSPYFVVSGLEASATSSSSPLSQMALGLLIRDPQCFSLPQAVARILIREIHNVSSSGPPRRSRLEEPLEMAASLSPCWSAHLELLAVPRQVPK
jgi:hypothetical protein